MNVTNAKLALLASVMTFTCFYEYDAKARRLVPDRPSVEVRLEALRSLKQSVARSRMPAQQSVPFATAPSRPAPSTPIVAQNIPAYQPKPPLIAPAPPKVAPAPAPIQPQPQIARAPKVVAPAYSAPKPPIKPVVTEYKPPVMQKPAEPVMNAQPARSPISSNPKPTVAPQPKLPAIVAEAKPVVKEMEKPQELAKQEPAFAPSPMRKPEPPKEMQTAAVEPEVLSLPPVAEDDIPVYDFEAEPDVPVVETPDDATEVLDLRLEDILPEDNQATPHMQADDAMTPPEDVPLLSLEELPPEDVPTDSATSDDALSELDKSLGAIEPRKEDMEELESFDNSEFAQLPEPDLEGLEFEAFEPLDTMETPNAIPEQTEIVAAEEKQPEMQLEPLPEVADSPPLLSPELAEISVETPSDVEEPEMAALPDVSTPEPIESDDAPALAASPPPVKTPEKKEGWLPNLRNSFSSFLSDDADKPTSPPAQIPDLPQVDEVTSVPSQDEKNLPSMPEVAADPELSQQADVEDNQDMPELVELDSLEAAPEQAMPAEPTIIELPEQSLPPLPQFDQAASATEVASDLPPLPSFGGQNNDVEEPLTLEPLPPLPFGTAPSPVETADTNAVEETQTAMLTLPDPDSLEVLPSQDDVALTVLFSKAETEVPLAYQQPLINLSKELVAHPDKKINVVAYASGTDDQKSIARRISLARALAVRAFLIDLGIDNVRISVQALGTTMQSGSSERADIIITSEL